jgi:hypothetical protein
VEPVSVENLKDVMAVTMSRPKLQRRFSAISMARRKHWKKRPEDVMEFLLVVDPLCASGVRSFPSESPSPGSAFRHGSAEGTGRKPSASQGSGDFFEEKKTTPRKGGLFA